MARPNSGHPFWTDAEVKILRTHRHVLAADLMEMLPGRSKQSIHMQRRVRGLAYQPPAPPRVEETGRTVGRSFVTASGVKAMMLPSGPVPYLACLYDDN